MKRFTVGHKALKAREDLVREAHFQYEQKRISRRDFLRFTTALGGGALAMGLLPPMERLQLNRANGLMARMQDATPKRGGALYPGLGVDTDTHFSDPATLEGVNPSNNIRQVCDYLVVIDYTLTLKPSLATSWTPSTDGLTWTVKLREGVKFNHGKDFNADDVVFTFSRLIDPATASGWAGAANYVTGVEKVDDHTVNFHTNRVAADFIYTLFLYHAAVLPADWPGDFVTNPWGTGPYTLDGFSAKEYIKFKRREDYWQMGTDGKSLPYLDTVEFDRYADDTARLSAMQEGSLDMAYADPQVKDQYTALTDFNFMTVQTGSHDDVIMHMNEDPWTNADVRQAFKLAVSRQDYVDTRWNGFATVADDQPLAPGIYPLGPTSRPARAQDVDQAKALLAKAGFPNGLDLTMTYIDPASDNSYADKTAQWLVGAVAAAGFRLTLAPNAKYFDTWLADWGPNMMGLDNWSQKNTASEILNLAYKSDGVWNESHFNNPDFDALLEKFDANLDEATRKDQLVQMADILSNDGAVMIPGYRQDAAVIKKSVHYNLHPQGFSWYGDAWIEST